MRLSRDNPMCKFVKVTVVLAAGVLAIAARQTPPASSPRLAGPAAELAVGQDETTQTTGPLPAAAVENYI
jgi:FlaG/FlaF family flagellin (archaellin)